MARVIVPLTDLACNKSQYRQRTAGLRTNALVCVGAAIFVDMAFRIGGPDGAIRVVAYVVSGHSVQLWRYSYKIAKRIAFKSKENVYAVILSSCFSRYVCRAFVRMLFGKSGRLKSRQ